MKITFAFALNNENVFEKKHFGETDKFAIYRFENKELAFVEELPNTFKWMDEVHEHGSKKKGNAIISFLKEKGVSVLVSKQFGRNIKMVNQHFVPVIIAEDEPINVIEILQKQMNWFKDELQNNGGYELVDFAAEDVLIVHPSIVDLNVISPDTPRTRNQRSAIVQIDPIVLMFYWMGSEIWRGWPYEGAGLCN